MKGLFLFLLFTLSPYFAVKSQSYIMHTAAGNGSAGYSGDGGPATLAELDDPWGVGTDRTGNFYIAEFKNQSVRMVNSNNIITTIAGIGVYGHSGDGGPATAAELANPTGVVVDNAGNIYIADQANNRIRMINTAGIISTLAGNGIVGSSGDGGPATAAEFDTPAGVALDDSGNLFIADFYNFKVRKINTAGLISTVAGTGSHGYSGDGGAATAAKLGSIIGVGVDIAGNVYIPDQSNGRVRIVTTNGIISTFAGNGTQSFSGDGGPATAAELSYPYGIATDPAGNIYIADYGNERIRLVNTAGIISTIAGSGYNSFSGDGGPATAAEMTIVTGVALNASGDVYIVDQTNDRIRMISPIETVVEQSAVGSGQWSVYPNPNNGKFFIEMKNEKLRMNNNLEIFNVLGERVYQSQLQDSISPVSISLDVPDGVYFLRIKNEQGEMNEKIVIER